MRDSVTYVVLIFFCFAFYFMCFISLQQQIRLRDSDIHNLICGRYNGGDNTKDGEWITSLNRDDNKLTRETGKQFDNLRKANGGNIDNDAEDDAVIQVDTVQKINRKRTRCPAKPPGLEARVKWKLGDPFVFKPVKYGGSWAPTNCRANEKVAIIVPYRDRKKHLDIFLPYMHAFLQKQLLQYRIFVVEMAFPTQFNRGLLANVGFITADSTNEFTCFIFHDVDLLPMNGTNLYTCSDKPRHMSVKNSKFGYNLPYEDYFGGIVAFRRLQFAYINGFSNMYFGWGAEDDDLRRRLESLNSPYERQEADIAYYRALPHQGDSGNPKNPFGHTLYHDVQLITGGGRLQRFFCTDCNIEQLLSAAESRKDRDGLNSIQYTRLALEFRELYTWVNVKADETRMMRQHPQLRSPPWTNGMSPERNLRAGRFVAFLKHLGQREENPDDLNSPVNTNSVSTNRSPIVNGTPGLFGNVAFEMTNKNNT